MKLKRIAIKNLLGVTSVSFEPGSYCEIVGKNGIGKTSVLEAIRSLAQPTSHDPSLLNIKAKKGELIIELEDGKVITKVVEPHKSSCTVKDPETGATYAPAAFISKLVDDMSWDPTAILRAKPADQVSVLLKSLPLAVTSEQLVFVPVEALEGVKLDRHALEVTGAIDKKLRELRRDANVSAKEKRTTIATMSATLPAEPEGGDWGAEYARLDGQLENLQFEQRDRMRNIETDAATASQAVREWIGEEIRQEESALNEAVSAAKSECSAKVDEIRRKANAEIDQSKEAERAIIETKRINFADLSNGKLRDRDAKLAEVTRNKDAALASVVAEITPKLDSLKASVAKAETMKEQSDRSKGTRELLAKLDMEALGKESRGDVMEVAIEKLAAYKTGLLSSFPIPGLEVRDQEIWINDIPLKRVNTAEKYRLCVEIAKLQAKGGVILLDGLESFDSENREAFKAQAIASGLQWITARVDDGPLTIKGADADVSTDLPF